MQPHKRARMSPSSNSTPNERLQPALTTSIKEKATDTHKANDAKLSQDADKENAPNAFQPPATVEDEHVDFDEDVEPSNSTTTSPNATSKKSTFAGGYDALKSFNGQVYKGMAVGGSHTWNYDPGVWKETKVEPDLWKIDFETIKRRAKNAPEGSGAPIGTEYHWLIVAHQYVRKTSANTYSTHLSGSKYKLAHKNATSNSWSIPTVKVQRDREMELLDDAKRRVQGLPPVLGSEKVKVEKPPEKGQQKLDSLFSKAPAKRTTENSVLANSVPALKRKRSATH